jgi:hypothetical protein
MANIESLIKQQYVQNHNMKLNKMDMTNRLVMGNFIGVYWFRKNVANYGRDSTPRSDQHNRLQNTYLGFHKNEVHMLSE